MAFFTVASGSSSTKVTDVERSRTVCKRDVEQQSTVGGMNQCWPHIHSDTVPVKDTVLSQQPSYLLSPPDLFAPVQPASPMQIFPAGAMH